MAARLFLVLALGWINGANAALHSLAFMRTTSSEVPNLPERVEVGSLDDVPFCRYDSNRRRVEPKQDWMTRVAADDPEYLERETQRNLNSQIINKYNMRVLHERFNQTGGVHIIQTLFSCQWDDVTGEVGGQMQHAYDGEDFLSFDLKTLTWTAASQQAVITKHKWDNDEGLIKYAQHYLTQECPEFLKKFLDYGKSSFLRTELPSLALLQKTPSSPIVCHATGFYPPRAMLFWTKDGEELHEDVEIGEVLPNLDGTFQMMAELKLSDPAEAWERYSCVFQIGDVNRTTKVTTLEKDAILTNRKPDRTVPIAVSVAALVLLAAAAAVGVVKCRRGGPSPEPSPDTSEGVLQPLKDPAGGPAHGGADERRGGHEGGPGDGEAGELMLRPLEDIEDPESSHTVVELQDEDPARGVTDAARGEERR